MKTGGEDKRTLEEARKLEVAAVVTSLSVILDQPLQPPLLFLFCRPEARETGPL